MGGAIKVRELTKSFNGRQILDGVTFTAEAGAITALFGPNGCGKSTLFNILSGMLDREGGTFEIDQLDPFKFSYIFQNYRESLLPWRNNLRNGSLPLEIHGIDLQAAGDKVRSVCETLGLDLDLRRYPYELSGGQQQLLAFLRAVVTEPSILFIDEPFSALDYETNLRLRLRLQEYYLRLRPTILLVSHNIEEAVHLASRIVVLSGSPAKVVEIIENSCPYPRRFDVLMTEQFHRTRDEVLRAFQLATRL